MYWEFFRRKLLKSVSVRWYALERTSCTFASVPSQVCQSVCFVGAHRRCISTVNAAQVCSACLIGYFMKGNTVLYIARSKRDGTRAETRFGLSAKRTSPFKSAGVSVQSTAGSREVRISGQQLYRPCPDIQW